VTKLLALAVLLSLAPAAPAQVVSKTVGQATMTADLSQAWPGGVIVARLRSRSRLGTTYAILDGRRALFYDTTRGPRALVPIPADTEPGSTALGIEIYTRRGRQRIPLDITIGPRDYPARNMTIPETRRHLPERPGVVSQARQFLLLVRSESKAAAWLGAFQPPVAEVASPSFGALQTWTGAVSVEPLTDALYGERGRGLRYEVPVGTLVQAPAAGAVLFAGTHELLGRTLVLDHGQGVVSVLAHLSRIDVLLGDRVESRTPLGASGDSGIAAGPVVEWRVYLHGIPVDPRVFTGGLD
jgi:murein DD-endopeptidase MepM/ murein hydrolase activator NlpD